MKTPDERCLDELEALVDVWMIEGVTANEIASALVTALDDVSRRAQPNEETRTRWLLYSLFWARYEAEKEIESERRRHLR